MDLQKGERVLLVLEPQESQFFEREVGEYIHAGIQKHGGFVSTQSPALITHPSDFPDHVAAAMGEVDHTVFLSRLGDYVRFTPMMGSGSKTICYVRTLDLLASHFTAVSHTLMTQLLSRLESELTQGENVENHLSIGHRIKRRILLAK